MYALPRVFARLALSSFLIIPLIQGQAVFAQTAGPKLDARSQRSIAAGPYSTISTAHGGLDTVIPFFSVEGPNGTKLEFAIRHRSNQAPGTFWGVAGGTPGAGWTHSLTDTVNINSGVATQYSLGNTIGEWNLVNYSTATSVPYDRRPTTRNGLTVFRATAGGNITKAEVTTLGDRTRWIYDKPIAFPDPNNQNLKLGSIVDACGNTINVSYYASGATAGLWSTVTDASSARNFTINYKLAGGQYVIDTVSLNYPGGSKIWTLNYDTSARLASIQFPPTVAGSTIRPTITMNYTAEGNIANLYDLKGNLWHYAYSSNVGPALGTLVCSGFYKPNLISPGSNWDPNGTTLSWTTTNPNGSTPGTKTCFINEPYGNVNAPSYRVRKHYYDNGGGQNNLYFTNPIRKIQDPVDSSEGNANYWEIYDWNYNDGTVADYMDRRGNYTYFTYDTQNKGQMQTFTDALGGLTKYIWSDDLLVSEVLPTQDRTIYGYNFTTRKLTRKIVDPSSDAFEPAYSRIGAVALRTEYTYTAQGELASVANGTLSSTLDYKDNPVTFSNYDVYGNARTVKDAAGISTAFTYDDFNNKLSVTPPSPSGMTSFTYDNWNRLTQTTFPGGATEKAFYDNNNNVTRTEDGNSNWTDFVIDPLNRVTAATHPVTTNNADNIVNSTVYDAAGRAVSITNGRGKVTGYSFNERDMPILINYPDGTTRQFRYDGNGNKKQFTNGRGQIATYTYDVRNLLTGITYGDSYAANVTYVYRADGLRDSMTDSVGMSKWKYDHARRVTEHYQPGPNKTVVYTYDNGGRLGSMDSGNGSLIWAYQYDSAYRPLSIWQQDYIRNSGCSLGFERYPNGSILRTWFPDQTKSYAYYEYDLRDRVTHIAHWDQHGVTQDEQQDIQYTYDNVGNIMTYADATKQYGRWLRWYQYDRANRLTWETDSDAVNPNFPIAYAYDKNGNRTGSNRNGVYSPYAVDDNDRLSSGDGYTLSSYDADGNPGYISGFPGFGSLTQSYDMMGRLRASSYGNGGSNQFKYDGDGKRVERKDLVDSTKTVRYVYNESGQVIADTDGSGNMKTHYLPGLGMMDAATGKRYYIRENGLGSQLALITDVNGGSGGDNNNIVSRTEYDAFGREYDLSSSTDKRSDFRFASKHGYITDTQSGLQLLGARYYLPVLGRFLTQDPIGHNGGLNLYAYCNNNPLANIDPLGLDAEALKAAQNKRYDTAEEAAIAFVYAVWDITFRNKEMSAAIIHVHGPLADGTTGFKGWGIFDVHDGGDGSVTPGMGGTYDVHIHQYAEGDIAPGPKGTMVIASNPFVASTPMNNWYGGYMGDTVSGGHTGHNKFIGTAVGIGLWMHTQHENDGSLKFIFPSPYQIQQWRNGIVGFGKAMAGIPQ